MKIYQRLAELVTWNPPAGSESEYRKYREIDRLIDTAPQGSRLDGNTIINEARSGNKRIEIITGYRHMYSNGFYGPWLSLAIVVTPLLAPAGFEVSIKCAGDIDRLNVRPREQAYNHILLNFLKIDLNPQEYEELERENSEYIDWDSIQKYVSDRFCNWLDSEYKG